MDKKNMHRSLAISFTLALVLGACSNNDANPQGSESPGTNQAPVDISFLMRDGSIPYAVEAKKDDPYFKEMSRLFSKWVGGQHNITFDFITGDYDPQLKLRLASGDYPDIIHTTAIDSPAHPTAVQDGIFLPLNDLLDKYGQNIKKALPPEIWKSNKLSKDGKIYALPKMAPLPSILVIYVRKDWLDKLGMKAPVTLDDYLAYFDAVKTHDLNGNGQNDEIPFSVRKDLSYGGSFFGYFGVYPSSWKYENGQMLPEMIMPQMKDAINFYKMLYEKGYINKDMFTKTRDEWAADIHADKVGMWMHEIPSASTDWDPSTFANKNATLDVLGGPQRTDGKVYLTPVNQGFANVMTISAKTKHPEDVMKFFDWAWSDDKDKDTFFSFGIKEKNYTVANDQINWSANSSENTTKGVSAFYQVQMSPSKGYSMSPLIIEKNKNAAMLKKGIQLTQTNTMPDDGEFMLLLDAYKAHPELSPLLTGSLFLDMFSKVVTGKQPIDSAFDKFVSDWKSRGGNDAMKQATDWYNSVNKK
ncbi:extracellular solute-binding protein [Paenibacillus sp. Root444D2]|uniref:extracellular solute-binding protein n=1 Tax=Paenibacillus sp. Root444D2 TaxID=1736538 RepID=UPI00070D8FB0|nr:extracellular solute-binding protein [Paenibacillus sp. Root444D2]KQX48828.1 hypothetical protein ASD40_11745 [Paenibacillus sp. Root444D2]